MGAVLAAPKLLEAVGFTSDGVTAGSFAARMMSATAKANGGEVPPGSLVALLQSAGILSKLLSTMIEPVGHCVFPAGAAGLSGTANAAVACIGSIIGDGIEFVASVFQDKEEKKRKEKETTATGWLEKIWAERERKRREEEEEKLMWRMAGICAVGLFIGYMCADKRNRRHNNTKKINQKVSTASAGSFDLL